MLGFSEDASPTQKDLYSTLAEKASMTCFLNSLLREWFAWSYEDLPIILKNSIDKGIRISLPDTDLWIPVTYFSELGRHEYGYPAYAEASGVFTEIPFLALVDQLVPFLDMTSSPQSEAKGKFRHRVQDSLNAIEELMSHRAKDFLGDAALPRTFVEAEQYLIIGHSFHPSPKSREGFTREDRFRFGPEYAGSFALSWFLAHDSLVRKISSVAFENRDWIAELAKSDVSLGILLDQVPPRDFTLFPINPWQARYLQTLPQIKRYIESGLLSYLGEHGDLWYPTSSVRSICRPAAPFMLKTSLNVRLTNSVRSLLKKEVDRGIQSHDVFQSSHGQSFQKAYPRFQILAEPAYIYLADESGEAIEESIVICRENPFAPNDSAQGLVLASLTQDNPYGGPTLIAQFVEQHSRETKSSLRDSGILWFQNYLERVVEPLLMAQAEYGILLGAHQQNILIAMEQGQPALAYFRDCQGTGYSEFAYQMLKDEVKSLDPANGNVLPNEMTQILFVYYIFINASFNVINSIARMGEVSEAELIGLMREKLVALLESKPRDPSVILHALSSPKIMHKGNFLCSISDINENTSTNPLAIYTAIHNPFYQEHGKGTHS